MTDTLWKEAGFDNPPSPQEVRLFIDQASAAERNKVKELVEAMWQARKLIGFVWKDGLPNANKSNEAYHLLYDALTKAGYTEHSARETSNNENT
jgi:hypothetical protein